LIVEDEALLREMMSGMLRRLGCRAILARNGREAVDIFRRSSGEIDIVILDLVMPELGGRDAYAQLREIQPTVRVIIASGYSLNSDVQGLLDDGVKGFIQKPFRLEEIAKAIVEAMENR
jgi:two-component system, cell cycle sensor histidine kinase and response regulator CckA